MGRGRFGIRVKSGHNATSEVGSRHRTGRIARFVARMRNGKDRTSGLAGCREELLWAGMLPTPARSQISSVDWRNVCHPRIKSLVRREHHLDRHFPLATRFGIQKDGLAT